MVSRMTEIIEKIRKNMDEIRKFGVERIGVFGSFSREDQRPESDVDLIVEFEEGKATLDNFLALSEFLEELLGRKVDLLTVEGVRSIRVSSVRKEIERSVIYVS